VELGGRQNDEENAWEPEDHRDQIDGEVRL
jgi:hypothetical protein